MVEACTQAGNRLKIGSNTKCRAVGSGETLTALFGQVDALSKIEGHKLSSIYTYDEVQRIGEFGTLLASPHFLKLSSKVM